MNELEFLQSLIDSHSSEAMFVDGADLMEKIRERVEHLENNQEFTDREIRMARLLLECRDALPAITKVSARLRNIDLSLADRIEEELEPWKVEEDE